MAHSLPVQPSDRSNTEGPAEVKGRSTDRKQAAATSPVQQAQPPRLGGRLSVLDIPHRQSSHKPSHQDSSQLQDILNPVRGIRDELSR